MFNNLLNICHFIHWYMVLEAMRTFQKCSAPKEFLNSILEICGNILSAFGYVNIQIISTSPTKSHNNNRRSVLIRLQQLAHFNLIK